MLFYLEKNFRIYLRNRFIKAIFVAHLSMLEPMFCFSVVNALLDKYLDAKYLQKYL